MLDDKRVPENRHELPIEVGRSVFTQARLESAKSLKELEKEFAFISPALLYTHGHLDKDVFQVFVNENKYFERVGVLDFNEPIFKLSSKTLVDWSRRLIIVERELLPHLVKYLNEIGILDREKESFFKALLYDLPILDPLWVLRKNPGSPQSVSVGVVGLDGNKCRWILRYPKVVYDPLCLPEPVQVPPVPGLAKEVKQRFFSGRDR